MQNLWNIIINFINSNSALWNFFVTIATIVYVILTYRLLLETAKARKSQNQPYIIADLIIERHFLQLVVKNIGNDSAFNVKITVDPEINNPFSSIEFLSPGREISNVVSFLYLDESNKSENSKYKFSISYEDPYKGKYSHEYVIDILPLLNATHFYESDNKTIVGKLDKLKDELHNISLILKKK